MMKWLVCRWQNTLASENNHLPTQLTLPRKGCNRILMFIILFAQLSASACFVHQGLTKKVFLSTQGRATSERSRGFGLSRLRTPIMKGGNHDERFPADDMPRMGRRAMLNSVWLALGGIAGYTMRDQMGETGSRASSAVSDPLPPPDLRKQFASEYALEVDDLKSLRAETEKEIQEVKSMQKRSDGTTVEETPLQKLVQIAPYGFIAAALSAQINFFRNEWEYAQDAYAGSEFTIGELILYRLDHYLSTEPLFKTLLLANAVFLIILLGATLLVLTDQEDFGNALWTAWTLVADAGTEQNVEGPLNRAVALVVSVGGLIVFALMVGFVTESVVEQVEDFKQGISRVLEQEHTVMLGFSDKSLSIIEQISLARIGQRRRTIVVLAEKPKGQMEKNLQNALTDKERGFQLHGTEVIFRTGDPAVESELFKVGADRANRIIALSRDDLRPQEADALMLRQVLSLRGVVSGSEEKQPSLVVELQDVDNKHLIDLISLKKDVLVTHDFIGRLMVRCAREEGLATVLEALMTFKGPEFYFQEWPELFGLTFEEISTRFVDAVPVGFKRPNGLIRLNPPRKYQYRKGYELIVLAENSTSYELTESSYEMPKHVRDTITVATVQPENINTRFSKWTRTLARARALTSSSTSSSSSSSSFSSSSSSSQPASSAFTSSSSLHSASTSLPAAGGDSVQQLDPMASTVGAALARRVAREPEKILFVGWRRDMADMISDLDSAVPEGSELWLFNAVPISERGYLLTDLGNKGAMNLQNLVIKNALGRPTLRQDLLRINCLDEFGSWTGESVVLTDFTSTLILADEKAEELRQTDVRSADGRSLASFLLIREIRRELTPTRAPRQIRRNACLVPAEGTLISEIVDSQNSVSLLRELGCRSYIMSNEIVSSALAQVSENRDMFGLISELFKDAGAGLAIVPVEDIVPNHSLTPMSFWDVALQGLHKGELVIGYKSKDEPWMAMAEWMQQNQNDVQDISWINPRDKDQPRQWECGDVLVVITSA